MIQKIGKKFIASFLTAILMLAFFLTVNMALAQETGDALLLPVIDEQTESAETGTAANTDEDSFLKTNPSVNQKIELAAVEKNPEWGRSALATAGLKFMIRGKEALAWTIGIDDSGFDNPAIETSYNKVLTIVNSLFILGLLGIAAMWMFSLIIPRYRLRRVIFIYVAAVIFVNFAMPATRLFIDGTSILQKTLLTQNDNPIGIVDIVEAPEYEQAVGYQNNTGFTEETTRRNINLSFTDKTNDAVSVGTIVPEGAAPDLISGTMVDEDGIHSIQMSTEPALKNLALHANQPIRASIESETAFNPNLEQAVFSFILMILTGAAYLLMALIFLARVVILWALMIVSPVIFLLAVFNATRGWFMNWLSLYGRWLFIGPLVALGLAVIVNIWQVVGLPVTSGYHAVAEVKSFGQLSSIRFYLPGSKAPNDLSTTNQMMEYMLFLMMLYLPVFFGFALTRQKTWSAVTEIISGRESGSEKQGRPGTPVATPDTVLSPRMTETGFAAGLKNFFTTQVGKITQTVLPGSMRAVPSASMAAPMPGASAFLPEQLALTPLPDMLRMIGARDDSRHSRDLTIGKLASPERIQDITERKHVEIVRREIEKRADQGSAEAILLNGAIQTVVQPAASARAENRINIETPTAAPINNLAIPIEEKSASSKSDTLKTAGAVKDIETIDGSAEEMNEEEKEQETDQEKTSAGDTIESSDSKNDDN